MLVEINEIEEHMKPIQTIVFDIGQVLAAFSPRTFIRSFVSDEGLAEEVARATVFGPYWDEVDRGVLALSEIVERSVALCPRAETQIREFYRRKNEIVIEFPYAAAWVAGYRASGYETYLLSNYSEDGYLRLAQQSRAIPLVNGGVISWQKKHIKPEPELYRALLETYQLDAETAVFIDDRPENIKAAEQFGFRTVLFEELSQTQRELEALGAPLRFDGILFDLDGTLWDSTEPAAVIWQEVALRHGMKEPVTAERLRGLYGLLLEEIAERLFPSADRAAAIAAMEECVTVQCPYLREHRGQLLGNIKEALSRLKQRYKLFIVSNCRDGYIEAFLDAFGLWELFDDFECPGKSGLHKAENIRLIAERHGLRAPLYVGDTAGDETAAYEAGVPFAHAAYGFGKAAQPMWRLASIDELAAWLT